ncbi:MAG: tetratricopeptide repeat protein, partial [Armatimonadetes bacterium]|nr:tetratricopeptide repeat protein [Armatimonadota bacterium]
MAESPQLNDLGREGEEQYSLLLTALLTGDSFELGFVCSQSRYVLDEVRRRLLEGEHAGVSAIDLSLQGPPDLERLLERLLGLEVKGPDRHAIQTYPAGLFRELAGAWTRALVVLNEQRNRVMATCPHYVLLFGLPDLTILAQDVAPDLWSVRSMVFTFPEQPSVPVALRRVHGWTDTRDDGDLLAHQLQSGEYYRQLADALTGSTRKSVRRSRLDLLLNAARAWQLHGEIDRAESALEDALRDAKWLHDDLGRAEALGQIADILQSRGELDEALRIRREEQLPVYERLGDVRSRAVTMGKIADILQDRGELDEALG